jgi:hypothetical protein
MGGTRFQLFIQSSCALARFMLDFLRAMVLISPLTDLVKTKQAATVARRAKVSYYLSFPLAARRRRVQLLARWCPNRCAVTRLSDRLGRLPTVPSRRAQPSTRRRRKFLRTLESSSYGGCDGSNQE